jgi:transcriptional regulator with XRE-family HTH domain
MDTKTIIQERRQRSEARKLRNMQLVTLRGEGKSLQEVADILGMTKQRVSQIEASQKAKQEACTSYGFQFTARTAKTLERLGVRDREHARKLYLEGFLKAGTNLIGAKTEAEIRHWVCGTDTCPHCGARI